MSPPAAAVERLCRKLRLTTPLIAIYDAPPSDAFAPYVEARGSACCFAFYPRWLKGETVVFRRGTESPGPPRQGCPGAHRALGLEASYPPHMAHFLTDGAGAPPGEGLKASPALAQEFLAAARPPRLRGATVLLGPLRLEQWAAVRSVTFLVDPDRLAGVMTLAGYWSGDTDLIAAPFSSGCGLLWRSLGERGRDRPVLGGTDIAMRRYMPPEILTLSVSPERFEQMLTIPDGSFLDKPWWNDLLQARGPKRS